MNRATFPLDTGSAMASSLQKAIVAKLSEFMGDYTDDILAQYILVLVAHGKQKSQAVKDLEAFLGDRSEDFVSWLWDYLCTNNLNDSVLKVGMSKMEPVSTERKVMVKEARGTQHEKQVPIEDSKLRAKALPDVDALPTKEGIEHGRDKVVADERSRSHHPPKRSRSPHHCGTHKEKTSPEVEHHHKRHLPPSRVNATRRLLQSAVRDAVAPAPGYTKCGSKRLRSVISTEIESAETLEDTNKKQTCEDIAGIDDIRQAEVVIPHISEDMHAVAPEKDMTSPGAHGQGSVWDRLGKVIEDRGQAFDNRKTYRTLTKIENSKLIGTNLSIDPDRARKRISSRMQERLNAPSKAKQNEQISEQTTLLASTNGLHEGPYFVDKGTDVNYLNRKEPVQQLGEVDQLEDIKSAVSSKISDPGLSYSSQKIAKIVVSVNAPKSESCEALDDKLAVIQDTMNHTSRASASAHVHVEAAIQQGTQSDSQKDILELKDRIHRVQLEMTKLRAKQPEGSDPAHKAQEGRNRPTVFVTNIHFAASKELVMAHFSQCGDIANVVMLMDGVSGQPKGSAYIEFRTQSAAEKALSLNETSFYSRILKVVSKGMEETSSVTTTTAQHSNSVMLRTSRGRFFGGSSSTFSKFTQYGSPTKLQWRREGTTGLVTSPQVIGKKQNPISKNFNRSFSYTRSVPTTATSEMLKGSSQVCSLADRVKTEEKA